MVNSSTVENDQLNQALDILKQTLVSSTVPPLPTEWANNREFVELYQTHVELRLFVLSLANGELNQTLCSKGYVPGVLKSFQANLRHLTWQTQMIASGDFSQRVDFMGEFAEAFNSMVEHLEEARRELERLAILDPLTGVFNRRHFDERALEEIQRAYRYHHPLTVIMMDLDHFKEVNDTYGHPIGDMALQHVIQICRTHLRSVDIIGRYGGEEFLILLPETPLTSDPVNVSSAQAVAERLRYAIAQTRLETDQATIPVTVSMGLATLLEPGGVSNMAVPGDAELRQLIARADRALYEAKANGRNQVRVA